MYNTNKVKTLSLMTSGISQRHCVMILNSDPCLLYKVFSFPFPLFRPNSFVIITANRVLHCNADTPEEMHHWITLLQRSKGDTRVEGQEFIVRGKIISSGQMRDFWLNSGVLVNFREQVLCPIANFKISWIQLLLTQKSCFSHACMMRVFEMYLFYFLLI